MSLYFFDLTYTASVALEADSEAEAWQKVTNPDDGDVDFDWRQLPYQARLNGYEVELASEDAEEGDDPETEYTEADDPQWVNLDQLREQISLLKDQEAPQAMNEIVASFKARRP